MALMCETQPRRFSSPHDTQSTVPSKAKLPPQLGKQLLRLIKINKDRACPGWSGAIPSQFTQLIAGGGGRTQSAAGVAPTCSKAESAFRKANKQDCLERKWPGLSKRRQARISNGSGGSWSLIKDSPGMRMPRAIRHLPFTM